MKVTMTADATRIAAASEVFPILEAFTLIFLELFLL